MFIHYWRMALAVYTRRKVFTAITVFCITLTLTILSAGTHLVYQTLSPGGEEDKAERTLQIATVVRRKADNVTISPPGFRLIEQYLRKLQTPELIALTSRTSTVNTFVGNYKFSMLMRYTDAAYWQLLNFRLIEGRVLTAADVDSGRHVAVISALAAKQMFGTRPAVGEKFSLNNTAFTVVGVVRESARMNALADIWLPHSVQPSSDYRQRMMDNYAALVLARRVDDFPAISAELAGMLPSMQFDDQLKNAETLIHVDNTLEYIARGILDRGDEQDSGAGILLIILWALAILFMALPAINLINLNTGRMMERRGEIGVRKAFGARTSQIVGQILFENFLLCLFGAVLALALTHLLFAWLEHSGLIPYLHIEFHWPVVFYSLLMTALFSLMSGAAPAWRTSRQNPVTALKGA